VASYVDLLMVETLPRNMLAEAILKLPSLKFVDWTSRRPAFYSRNDESHNISDVDFTKRSNDFVLLFIQVHVQAIGTCEHCDRQTASFRSLGLGV
jgi:hypothetical protein